MFFRRLIAIVLLIIGVCLFNTATSQVIYFGTVDGTSIGVLVFSVLVILGAAALWGWERKQIVLGIVSTVFGGLNIFFSFGLYSTMSKKPEMAAKMQDHPVMTALIIGFVLLGCGIASIIMQKTEDKVPAEIKKEVEL